MRIIVHDLIILFRFKSKISKIKYKEKANSGNLIKKKILKIWVF